MLLSILEEVRVALTAPAAVSADPRFARAGRNRPRGQSQLTTCCLQFCTDCPGKYLAKSCMSFPLCLAQLSHVNLVLCKTPQGTVAEYERCLAPAWSEQDLALPSAQLWSTKAYMQLETTSCFDMFNSAKFAPFRFALEYLTCFFW